MRSFSADEDAARLIEHVPELARYLVNDCPPDSLWVPEVHAQLVFLSIYRVALADGKKWVDIARARNRALLSSPLYYPFFRLFSGRRVARTVASGWGRFHRGSESEVIDHDAHSVIVRLKFPAHLFPAPTLDGSQTAIEEALKIAGCRDVSTETLERTPSLSVTRTKWM